MFYSARHVRRRTCGGVYILWSSWTLANCKRPWTAPIRWPCQTWSRWTDGCTGTWRARPAWTTGTSGTTWPQRQSCPLRPRRFLPCAQRRRWSRRLRYRLAPTDRLCLWTHFRFPFAPVAGKNAQRLSNHDKYP